MRNIVVLLGCSAALLCMEFYSLFPFSETMIRPFPFHPQELSKQSYLDYAATRAGFCVLFLTIWWMSGKQWQYLVLFILICGYLIDYLLIYNNPFSYFYLSGRKVPLSYTLFMILSIGVVIYKTIAEEWKTS